MNSFFSFTKAGASYKIKQFPLQWDAA